MSYGTSNDFMVSQPMFQVTKFAIKNFALLWYCELKFFFV